MPSNSSTSDDYVVKETATLNWTIVNFANQNNQVLSEPFSPPNSRKQFHLYLNPKTNILVSEYVLIYLSCNRTQNELPMEYRVSILGANGEKRYTQKYRWVYKEADTANNEFNNLNFTNFISYNSCLKYLVNGNLILRCEVDVLGKSQVNGQVDLLHDYQALLESSEFSDVVLLVKEKKEFKAYKNILAARSKVFRAMFSNDLKEKKQNRVEITDVEVDVFEQLLFYIYTGKIPKLNDYALELFVTADKYQLDHLKSTCEHTLGSNLTIESVVNFFVIADMHNASELKSKCIEYINANSVAVKKTEEWKQIKARPVLLMELYDNVTAKLDLTCTYVGQSLFYAFSMFLYRTLMKNSRGVPVGVVCQD